MAEPIFSYSSPESAFIELLKLITVAILNKMTLKTPTAPTAIVTTELVEPRHNPATPAHTNNKSASDIKNDGGLKSLSDSSTFSAFLSRCFG